MIKKKKKINPNEYGSLIYNRTTLRELQDILLKKKIFRFASKNESAVDQFETAVKNLLNVTYALGLNNGTSALKTALRAVEIRPGDRVLISSYTFIATAASVISFGATPVPIDFDMVTGMNIPDLRRELEKGCRVIIPVHIQGYTFKLAPLLALAKQKKIPVIEDACQAFAARYKGTFAGCFADIGVYSFQQYKQVSSGEGGLLVTNNEAYFKKAKIYSDHGMVRESMSWDSEEAMIGDNYRMSNLEGAILKTELNQLGGMISDQRRNKKYILSHIDNAKTSCIIKSLDESGETGMNILFLAGSKETADKIISEGKSNHVEFRRLWDRPYYQQGIFERMKLTPHYLKKSDCTIAQEISQKLLSLSVPPTLKMPSLKKIVREIKKLQKQNYII